jgi:hypothetical protein
MCAVGSNAVTGPFGSLQEIPSFALPLLIRVRYADATVAGTLPNTILLGLFLLHYGNRYARVHVHARALCVCVCLLA